MKDTHWMEGSKPIEVNPNDVTAALCDMRDIQDVLSAKIKAMPKDNDGTDFTIGDCIDDVIKFLEQLEGEWI
jgi:hypothetical protein